VQGPVIVVRPHTALAAVSMPDLVAAVAALVGPSVRVVSGRSVVSPIRGPLDARRFIREAGWAQGTIAIVPASLRTRFLSRASGWTDRRRGVALVSTDQLDRVSEPAAGRLAKLVAHELLHVLGIGHCRRTRCIARPVVDVAELAERTALCQRCRGRLELP
jgi:hypothetical protein